MPASLVLGCFEHGGAEALIARVRDHFIAQFKSFVVDRQRNCTHGASELKLLLDEPNPFFQRLYCLDFISNDGEYQRFVLEPEGVETFDVISVPFGAAALSISPLRWDAAVVQHDLALMPLDEIAIWHRRWFDPDDERLDPNAALSGVIHALTIESGALLIDFGTAPPDAFWELLRLLESAGAKNIRVVGAAARPPTEAPSPSPTSGDVLH